MRTLLVQTDASSVDALQRVFRAAGILADPVDTVPEAMELARLYDYDVVVADLASNGLDGIELVRRMRVAKIATPVILLSGPSRPEARIRAFSAGADDVLSKPFDTSELTARMQAIVRRTKGFFEASLAVGNVTLRQDSRQVLVGETEIRLTGKEFAILELMTLRRGAVLTKDAFLNHLYGGMDEPEAKIIDVFICKLRKKLALAGADIVIATVWGRGYMLREAGPVAGIGSGGREAPVSGSASPFAVLPTLAPVRDRMAAG